MKRRRSFPTKGEYVLAFLRSSPGRVFSLDQIGDGCGYLPVSARYAISTARQLDHRVERVSRGRYRFNPGPPPNPDPADRFRELTANGHASGENLVETITDFLYVHSGPRSVADIAAGTGIIRPTVGGLMGRVLESHPYIIRLSRGVYRYDRSAPGACPGGPVDLDWE